MNERFSENFVIKTILRQWSLYLQSRVGRMENIAPSWTLQTLPRYPTSDYRSTSELFQRTSAQSLKQRLSGRPINSSSCHQCHSYSSSATILLPPAPPPGCLDISQQDLDIFLHLHRELASVNKAMVLSRKREGTAGK